MEEIEGGERLLDNLDKGWPTRGTTTTEILVIRTLLEATRKLQQDLLTRDIEFRCLVFLRRDIYQHLQREVPDKGKDTAIRLDWDDEEVFREIVLRRISSSTGLEGKFDEIWPIAVEPLIGVEDSFNYLLERTLMRPRDLLNFVRRSLEVALNRGHDKVTAGDILQAERSYSEDMLTALVFEIKDTCPDFAELPHAFVRLNSEISSLEVYRILEEEGLDKENIEKALDMLLWFGFLGVAGSRGGPDTYSYSVQYNTKRLRRPIERSESMFTVHPAFRQALDIES